MHPKRRPAAMAVAVAVLAAVACTSSSTHPPAAGQSTNTTAPGGAGPGPGPGATGPSPAAAAAGIAKIKHIVVIMQENRSFDTYFGTYPGADGIPMQSGVPMVCVPNPAGGACVKPYVDHADVNGGGPHGQPAATADIHGGKMDGFVGEVERARQGCADPNNPACTASATPDVMGYHTQGDLPNYWTYAQNFVLQDHMFEPNASWSLPEHLFQVSEWSAHCTQHLPSSCTNACRTRATPQTLGPWERQLAPHPSTPGPTSPTCCIAATSVGATTW